MSERIHHDERTEAPTARRLERARIEGRTALSRDLVGSAVMLAGFGGILFFCATMYALLSTTVKVILGNLSSVKLDGSTAILLLEDAIKTVIVFSGPILLITFVVAVLSTWLQVGFQIRLAEIAPDLGRIDPFRNMRKIFSHEGFGRLAFGFLKISAVILVLVHGVRGMVVGPEAIVGTGISDPAIIVSTAGSRLVWLFITLSGVLLLISAGDWAHKRWQYRQSLMMSRTEVEDENREAHGDPLLRRRRRDLHEKLLVKREER